MADRSLTSPMLGRWWTAGLILAAALVVGSRLTDTPFLAFASLPVSVILLGYATLVIVERSKR
jgi:hypothetical protein